MKKYLRLLALLLILGLFATGLDGCEHEKTPLVKETLSVSLVKTKPEGKISNSDNIAIFSDGVVEIICTMKFYYGFKNRLLPQITITNLSEDILIIDWNTASFIDPSGKAHRAVYEGVKYIKATEEVPPVTLAPNSRFKTMVVAADLVRYDSIFNTWIVDSPLEGYKNPSFSLVIPIKKGGEIVYYTLDYQVIVTEEVPPPKPKTEVPPPKPKTLKEKTIHVGIDTIPLGVYTSVGEGGEPDTLVGLSLNLWVLPGIGFRKYFKIDKEFFAYGELGTLIFIPYLGLGTIYTNKDGLEVGFGINLYPGLDENGNFLVEPLPNVILAIRF
ncbi:MAG: hypothetical protein ACP5PC_09740 [bacterium]